MADHVTPHLFNSERLDIFPGKHFHNWRIAVAAVDGDVLNSKANLPTFSLPFLNCTANLEKK